MHLPLDSFIRQIERVARTHEFIDIEDDAAATASGRPRAVITFDDAYNGAVTLALPELVKRGLPAVVFVSPALLGTESTWWDEVAEAGLLTDAVREHALASLAGRSSAVRQHMFGDRSPPTLPESHRIATLEDLVANCGPGIRVGSHTWGHEYLPALTIPELRSSLARTLQWLDTFDGATSRWLALPYGGGDATVGRAALDAGHKGVLRISGGLWNRHADRRQGPRINVPAGLSVRGLDLRKSGLKT